MRTVALLVISLLTVALAGSVPAQDAEQKISMNDLPPAVQRAVRKQSKGATVGDLSREVEDGATRYEATITAGGHSRDVVFEADGQVAAVEVKTPLALIPAPAREAIEKSAGSGKILFVEAVTEHGDTSYEAHILKGQRAREIKVNASGEPVK